jgi:hypothetical protein
MKLTSGFKLSAKVWFPVVSIGLIASAVAAWLQARPVVPAEYLTLKAVVSRLAAHNSLGSAPISFSINSGSYAASLAEMRGLCKAESCDFYAQLNPYKSYGKDWDEISRQSYTLGDIGAWTTSSGTIEISRGAAIPSFTRSPSIREMKISMLPPITTHSLTLRDRTNMVLSLP